MKELKYNILTKDERLDLVKVLYRQKLYYENIKKHVLKMDELACNAMLIYGPAGTGKTTVVNECLTQLKSEDIIDEIIFKTGHITMTELITLLRQSALKSKSGKRKVLLLDDVDIWSDNIKLEPLKSALDTRNPANPNNRRIRGVSDPSTGKVFDTIYEGYCIIITNKTFEVMNADQAALLSRVCVKPSLLQLGDYKLFALNQIEELLNNNTRHLSDDELDTVMKFVNDDFRPWLDLGVFENPNLNPICKYNLRLIQSFIDEIIVYKNSWKMLDIKYRLLDEMRKSLEPKAV